ncbi:MAG: NADPH-dependent oxidoreductase [Plectolyngbya sp. WJT66-NPBG17]|jgi:nitroreductase|nr:NADPH-dependent oxidoreductase [Plectolyngbya sp. WJT66-NPBG17]MBW4528915.1 NADPH-dependent oxidoreductase [Phormidium tanganyikae FI6-MK23]
MILPNELLRSRYGTISFDIGNCWTPSLETLLSHRSIRAYRSVPLPPSTLETLIAAAQSASTSSNLQTWSVVAVEDVDRKAQLAEVTNRQAHIYQAPLFLVWLADLARLTRTAEQLGLPHEGLDYLEMFLMASIDASLAAQNAVVAAESLGLGTVYIGALRNRPEEVAAILGLPPLTFAVFGLCVGYADPDKPAAIKPRLPQPAILHREQYQSIEQDVSIVEYNEQMRQFYTDQKMNVPGDWAEHSAKRIATREALSGRDRLREALHHLGFELR